MCLIDELTNDILFGFDFIKNVTLIETTGR